MIGFSWHLPDSIIAPDAFASTKLPFPIKADDGRVVGEVVAIEVTPEGAVEMTMDLHDLEVAQQRLGAIHSHMDAIGASYCDTCAGPDSVGRERPAAGTPEEYLLTLAFERHLKAHSTGVIPRGGGEGQPEAGSR